MTEAKPVTSKQMRKVKKQRVPAFGRIDNKINTVGLEKVVFPVSWKIKVPTTFTKAMDEVAVTSISDVPINKRFIRVGDGRFKARLVTPAVRMQRHGTDRAIVAVKVTFGRSQNGALAEGVKLRQAVG